jgi:SAM-dependent methyltransferase
MEDATSTSCPLCGQAGMQAFYEARNIPVHSVLLVPDRDTALSYTKRDLILGSCPDCGFIANTAFDSSVQDYSPQCEETQGFSPTFNVFARSMAKRLSEDYGMKGKRVIEIGCGKGEFIALLCELGMEQGIGIDPTYVPDRLQSEAAKRVEFIQDFYSERHAHLSADLICCRHTLEHIGPVGSFLRMLRRNIGDRTETLAFFEVPDTLRILREAAFWDIYYEHCSYFTAASLARLFWWSGFEVIDLRCEYDEQYLTLLARPLENAVPPLVSSPAEGDLAEVVRAVKQFPKRFEKIRRKWVGTIRNLKREGKRIVLWGSGSKAVGFIVTLGFDEEIEYVVDVNPHKQGKFMPGVAQQIVAPSFLRHYRPDCVIIMNPVYKREIHDQLASMALEPMVIAL